MNTQIYEEATEWLIKHREGDLDLQERGQFDNWLRQSPQHVRAYLEMSAIWEDLPALGADWNPTPDELIARANTNANIRPLARASGMSRTAAAIGGTWPAAQESGPKRVIRARLFAVAAGMLIAIAGVALWYGFERDTYATQIGEQRSIVLEDGSTLELNSRSRVRIRYTRAQRDVELLAGQALFRVAHDTSRPFVVHSGMTRVLAVGTQFDVYKKRTVTVVTVVDGKVEVLAGASLATAPNAPQTTPPAVAPGKSDAANGIFLTAGEQITIPLGKPAPATKSAPGSPQPANVASVTAWTQHNLVFEAAPLTEVAEEFNRYNKRPLVITDSRIANMRISGMFSSADPALLLKFLRAQAELSVEETDGEIRIGRR